MEFMDSINIEVFDINRCSKCGEPTLPEDEVAITENMNGGVIKIDHFNCAYPRGGT